MVDSRAGFRRALRGLMLRRQLPFLLPALVLALVALFLPDPLFQAPVVLLMLVPVVSHLVPVRRWRDRPPGATLRLLVHWQGDTGGNGFHLLWSDNALWFVPGGICASPKEIVALLRDSGLDGFTLEEKNAFYRGGWERAWREGRLSSFSS